MAELSRRPQEFLVFIRGQQNLSMAGASPVFADIGGLAGVRRIDTIRSSNLTLLSAGPAQTNTTLVVAAETLDREDDLWRRSALPGSVAITPNRLLQYFGAGPRFELMAEAPRAIGALSIQLRIVNPAGAPIPNVLVKTYGSNGAQGLSDANGSVVLAFFSGSTVCDAVYIKPAKDYWERWTVNPDLVNGSTVTLQPLSAWQQANFSAQAPYASWAENMLGLDVARDTSLTGAGVRVAVADSGCDTTHSMAQRFTNGVNYTDANDPAGWNVDLIGHGTWCSTLIGGYDASTGRRGFAPQAEMHTLRIFPGGTMAALQRCLVYCVDNNIDVLSLSLGSNVGDPGTSSYLQEALQHGVAIFVAAGNTYGPVSFPATEPGAFAVAALGQAGRFPPNTYHAQTQIQQSRPGAAGSNGIFAPDFTAAGQAIQGCAPGVAVISGAPGNGFAAEDGTSMACPGMAGLATLFLAHHPVLRGQPRSAERTQTLYQLLQTAGQPTGLAGDFSGAGMPTLAGLSVQASAPAPASLRDLLQRYGIVPPPMVNAAAPLEING
jgi:subtilisin